MQELKFKKTAQISSADRLVLDLWWTKWQSDRFFAEYFANSLYIFFRLCSILLFFLKTTHNRKTRERSLEKKTNESNALSKDRKN